MQTRIKKAVSDGAVRETEWIELLNNDDNDDDEAPLTITDYRQ
jgi:hypothetical protein